ncbi:hypothetical protein ACIBAI_13275 [Streptomyces sp. NPDC051041]|uniref:hypothetical protein n=1 Tax=Streptomyces sp. NPDC051041 TaxID=3365640 RepID=UPI00379A59D7
MNPLAPRLLAPLLLAAGCALLTACSGDRDPAPAPPSPAVTATAPAPRAPEPPKMPIDPYRISNAEHAELRAAEQLLVNACLERLGSDYRSPHTAVVRPAPEAPYGITDRQWARDHGYRIPPGLQSRPDPDAAQPDATAQALITGGVAYAEDGEPMPFADVEKVTRYRGRAVPEGGCLGEARRTLAERDDNRDLTGVPRDIYGEAYQKSQQDPEVKRVFAAWSDCMREKGHDYASPLDPSNDPRFPEDPPASADEKRTAVADVACKERTGLVAVWHRVESAIERSLMAEHPDELAAARADRETRLANARRVNARHD